MCGIIAGIAPNIIVHLLEGLRQLQNRGYDSAGITLIKRVLFILKNMLPANDLH